MRRQRILWTSLLAAALLVPASVLAQNGSSLAYQDDDRSAGSQYSYGAQTRLSPQDQSKFDKYYSKWVDAQRRNDRDDVDKNARHMQDIMAHYNIPANVPFDQIATNGAAYGASAYPNTPAAYANNGYAWHGRLSPDDQQKFDKYYSKWMDAQRKNDRDDVDKNARKMSDIMAHYNIPPNVSFDQVASPGAAYGGPGANAGSYPGAYGPGRLSADDQKKFDKQYSKWLDARRRNDSGDADRAANHMQDIMAHYNIPANVPFDRIASPGVGARY